MRASFLLFIVAAAMGCDDKSVAAPPGASASAVASIPSPPPPASSPSASPSATAPPISIAAQHILVAYRGAERAPAGVTRSKGDAKTRAAEVDAKAEAGEDFSALVAQYSDDPGAKDRQGSLGKFTRDKMDKAFSDAAFALRVGEISEVVETRFGFHVIRRNQ
jgi:peptidyl-prolyl cis-trans isomerase NIMA-interacting 1